MKAEPVSVDAGNEDAPVARGVFARLRGLAPMLLQRVSSSLVRRIVVLNLAGLVALLIGFLYLNQFREGLIEARVQSLLIQGEIIAGAIASSATVETDTITIDPDRLLQMQAGETDRLGEEGLSPLEFSINPERVAPLLRRLVTPTPHPGADLRPRGRAAARFPQPSFPRRHPALRPAAVRRRMRASSSGPGRSAQPFPRDEAARARGDRPGERQGPAGGPAGAGRQRANVVRGNERGETIVSVAVPIQRFRSVRGRLLLSTQGGDIDAIIASERFALLQVFIVAALVMMVLSLFLAGAIVGPVRRLADAAERVRWGSQSRQEIPDFTARSDEIGHLSGALRDMTRALYNRIDAIESFAADVAHELKNPLTSLRSAVETLPLAKKPESAQRLMSIIQHDVRRLDRLISDISDASRLDAELARVDAEPVDIARLARGGGAVANERRHASEPLIALTVEPLPAGDARSVLGHDSRLGQVINNLIDNARSFSPPDSTVRVTLRRRRAGSRWWSRMTAPAFRRTPSTAFSSASTPTGRSRASDRIPASGLSISRQIVEAHRGTIKAENRPGPPDEGEPTRLGARFIVRLPVRDHG